MLDTARQSEVVGDAPLNIVVALPPEVEQYADDIRRFLDAMVYKLGLNAHKGRWENISAERAMELLKDEVEELTEALRRGNLIETTLESADVANFALMISAIAIERGVRK
jgi:NTP pyrophosphatase (non-canonical NTP hydrolase)